MKGFRLNPYALGAYIACATLAACGASQSSIGAQGSIPRSGDVAPQFTSLPAPPVRSSLLAAQLTVKPQKTAEPILYVSLSPVEILPENTPNSSPIGSVSNGVDGVLRKLQCRIAHLRAATRCSGERVGGGYLFFGAVAGGPKTDNLEL